MAQFDPNAIFEALLRREVDFVLIGGLAGLAQDAGWPTYDAARRNAPGNTPRATFGSGTRMPYRDSLETLRERRNAVRDEYAELGFVLGQLDAAIFAAAKKRRHALAANGTVTAGECANAVSADRRAVRCLAVVASALGLYGMGTLLVAMCLPTFTCHGPIKGARRDASAITFATYVWRTEHDGQCPTVSDLLVDGQLDRHKHVRDPWHMPYDVECSGDSVTVRSAGPDGDFRSEDDIVL